MKFRGTFTTNLTNKTNKIHIYLLDKDEEIRLKINYYVKNSISQKGDGYGTYYNKFLAHRSGLSYNTQFKGNIRFFMPKGSRYDFAGYSKDIYVEAKDMVDNIANIYFENKLQHNFSINMYRVDGYEHITWRGEYSKEFAIETRVDFSLKNPYTQQTYINYKPYSIDELKEMNRENKKEYSNILFILNILMINLFQSILPYLIVTFPHIRWYYKKKLNEYWEYRSKGN